jgi:hypothetical protein
MLKWASRHPGVAFVLITLLLCIACGPYRVGATYHAAFVWLVQACVSFVRGLL